MSEAYPEPLTRWVPGAKISDRVHAKLKRYCKINGLFMSQAVREALELYTQDMED